MLSSVPEPQLDATFAPATQTFTYAASETFATLAEAREAFPDTWPIDEDGFAGEIPQTSFEAVEYYGARVRIVDSTETYGPYPTNDVAQLPESAQSAAPTWTITAKDARGVPTEWMATVLTKTAITETYLSGYTVTVSYAGTLAKDEQRMVVTATYLGSDPDAASELQPIPELAPKNGMLAGVIAGGSAAVLAAFGIIFLVRSRNVTICSRKEEKVLAKVHAKRTADALQVTVPARISLADGVVLLLRPNLCDGGVLQVRQAGVTVFAGCATRRVEVDAPSAGV